MSKKFFEQLKKKYPLEKKDTKEIILDTYQIKEISEEEKEYMEQFQKVETFSLNNTHLKSLNNLPNFPSLTTIELSDNFISGEEISKLKIYENLKKIRIANNKIKNLNDMEILSNFKNLTFLDLSENPINSIFDYKRKIFNLIPSLNFLDMEDKEGKNYSEYEEEEDEIEEKEIEEEEEEKDEESFIINDKEENENEDEEKEEEEEEEEYENNYSNKRGLKKFYGRGRKQNNKNNKIRNKYYVVKITTFGPNPNIAILQLLFNKLPNCKKKFLNKNGKIHGFLNFENYDDAIKIVKEYTEHTPSYDGCGVKLSLQSVPLNH
jgi:hypothetical protein